MVVMKSIQVCNFSTYHPNLYTYEHLCWISQPYVQSIRPMMSCPHQPLNMPGEWTWGTQEDGPFLGLEAQILQCWRTFSCQGLLEVNDCLIKLNNNLANNHFMWEGDNSNIRVEPNQRVYRGRLATTVQRWNQGNDGPYQGPGGTGDVEPPQATSQPLGERHSTTGSEKSRDDNDQTQVPVSATTEGSQSAEDLLDKGSQDSQPRTHSQSGSDGRQRATRTQGHSVERGSHSVNRHRRARHAQEVPRG